MKEAIGYLRVSTAEQGRSGLGLAAQRLDINGFASRESLSIKTWYKDVQTGAGKDPLLLRPGLAAALKEAAGLQCPLIVSRLDRLSRNVHFITGLMEHRVHFIIAAFGRDVDNFTLHIYASIAEQERKMISERAKATAAIAKRRGRKFGVQLRPKSWQRRISAKGRATISREAQERAEACRIYLEWAFKQPGVGGKLISFRAAAVKLNERSVETPMGGRWWPAYLKNTARRLGLNHPLTRMPEEFARARVRSLWEQRPTITGDQVVAAMGAAHSLDIGRARGFLKECRRGAARRSQMHNRVGWILGRTTVTRIRVSEMWNRHRDYTASQIMEKLALGPDVQERSVLRILTDCRKAIERSKVKRRRIGHRFNNPRRGNTLPLDSRAKKEARSAGNPKK